MQQARRNVRYLPEANFPAPLQLEHTLKASISGCRDVLISVPSHALRKGLTSIKPYIHSGMRVAWATKGFESTSGKLPHQVAAEVLGETTSVAVLSGPTFAREVGAGLPSALTVAASDAQFANDLATSISSDHFRAYTSTDLIGVEVGGAVKNVLAIGAAISDGLGFGANTRIALITRGLAEMVRLGVALGAQKDTFTGLAGLGDLVLTCTDNQSRNRRFGLAFAAGTQTAQAQQDIGQVVEGVAAATAVMQVASQHHVDMPICRQVYRMLQEGLAPQAAFRELMSRGLKSEVD
jgi:glycerol-3-phosphate dehydrogenase (NAD(P)+)